MIKRFLAAALASFLVWPAFAFAQVPKAGVVTRLQGNASRRGAWGMPSPVPLKRDDDVFLMDTITAGDGARIEMSLGGGKVDVAMQARSTVTISEVPGRATLVLQTGQFAITVRGDRLRRGEAIDVRTPNMV